MAVKITSKTGEPRIWSISKALLFYYSGYFERVGRLDAFIEGRTNKASFPDFEPDTFEPFIEFIYYGRYSYKDDLIGALRIRDSAKAWVSGDYLDAVEFKNLAIRNLYDIYMPSGGGRPKSGIGPDMVDYCCSKTAPRSRLSMFVLSVLLQNWHHKDIIHYQKKNGKWNDVWEQHSEFRNDLLYFTNQDLKIRGEYMRNLDFFLERLAIVDETCRQD
ncbi:hypothetical protein N0V90_000726 [Kalmusia sp. IMI 367209]|nr:hypothetical protein N0V90_000726 [Kalmusia sp. IMI 367209]